MKVAPQINDACKFLHAFSLQVTIDFLFAAATVEKLGMSCPDK